MICLIAPYIVASDVVALGKYSECVSDQYIPERKLPRKQANVAEKQKTPAVLVPPFETLYGLAYSFVLQVV